MAIFDIGQTINIQNGPKEDGTLKLIISKGDESLTVDFRGRSAVDESGERIGWNDLGFRCLPTFASNVYELKIDLSSLDVKPGDKVSLQFAGSDSLDKPAELVLSAPATTSRNSISWAKPDGAIRIVNQNTLQNGLADSERQAKFKRLFTAVNADVYCFQEEWDKDKFLDGISKTVPSNGKPINYAWEGGCGIATTHKMFSVRMKLDRATAGLVAFPDGQAIVVISVHFKCCGFAGSKEDDLRIQQAQQIVGEIKRMRQGEFGVITEFTPVVVIGDFNLVGSRKPLDIINAAGLKNVICRSADGGAATWRGLEPDSSFWPGRLDLATYRGYHSITGRIFDSSQLGEDVVQRRGVELDDSTASDHLMLVLDCFQ